MSTNAPYYLVTISVNIGGYEKITHVVVQAKDDEEAGTLGLREECHNEPDFTEYPDQQACWDGGEFFYMVYDTKELTHDQHVTLKNLKLCW